MRADRIGPRTGHGIGRRLGIPAALAGMFLLGGCVAYPDGGPFYGAGPGYGVAAPVYGFGGGYGGEYREHQEGGRGRGFWGGGHGRGDDD